MGMGTRSAMGMGMGWEWELSAWEWELRRVSGEKIPIEIQSSTEVGSNFAVLYYFIFILMAVCGRIV